MQLKLVLTLSIAIFLSATACYGYEPKFYGPSDFLEIFETVRMADQAINVLDMDDTSILTSQGIRLKRKDVEASLKSMPHRGLLVLWLDKRTDYGKVLEQLEPFVKELGYRRVLILGSAAFGVPVVRDFSFSPEMWPGEPEIIRLNCWWCRQDDSPSLEFESLLTAHFGLSPLSHYWEGERNAVKGAMLMADQLLSISSIDDTSIEVAPGIRLSSRYLRSSLKGHLDKRLLVVILEKGVNERKMVKQLEPFLKDLGYLRVLILGSSAFGPWVVKDLSLDPRKAPGNQESITFNCWWCRQNDAVNLSLRNIEP